MYSFLARVPEKLPKKKMGREHVECNSQCSKQIVDFVWVCANGTDLSVDFYCCPSWTFAVRKLGLALKWMVQMREKVKAKSSVSLHLYCTKCNYWNGNIVGVARLYVRRSQCSFLDDYGSFSLDGNKISEGFWL